jgi:DNA invertase Pin-like site-specific DNA recombinase
VEYVDRGVSGAKDRRPALDQLLADAKRRKFDVVVCWRLDRLGRNLKHLITLLEDLQALGIAFVSLAEGIDATTPASSRCTSWARSLIMRSRLLSGFPASP